MTEYISRQYLLNEYDRQHQGPPGGARKIIEEAPAEDVVPIEPQETEANPGLCARYMCADCPQARECVKSPFYQKPMTEEIADVEVCVDQLTDLIDFCQVESIKEFKYQRWMKRLEDDDKAKIEQEP